MAGAGRSAPYRWTMDEEGFVLRVPGEAEGAEETHYFPRASVIKIVLTDAR